MNETENQNNQSGFEVPLEAEGLTVEELTDLYRQQEEMVETAKARLNTELGQLNGLHLILKAIKLKHEHMLSNKDSLSKQ